MSIQRGRAQVAGMLCECKAVVTLACVGQLSVKANSSDVTLEVGLMKGNQAVGPIPLPIRKGTHNI